MTIGKYYGYRLYLISYMDRYSVYSTYTLVSYFTPLKKWNNKALKSYLNILVNLTFIQSPHLPKTQRLNLRATCNSLQITNAVQNYTRCRLQNLQTARFICDYHSGITLITGNQQLE